jgi:RNA recognition motif-containing protein
MGKKLYVGNLPFSATDQVLADTFAQCGKVESAKIIMDRDSGRSKGFGFVEMSTDEEAQQAISKLNGVDYEGRAMTVNEARPVDSVAAADVAAIAVDAAASAAADAVN